MLPNYSATNRSWIEPWFDSIRITFGWISVGLQFDRPSWNRTRTNNEQFKFMFIIFCEPLAESNMNRSEHNHGHLYSNMYCIPKPSQAQGLSFHTILGLHAHQTWYYSLSTYSSSSHYYLHICSIQDDKPIVCHLFSCIFHLITHYISCSLLPPSSHNIRAPS